MTDASYKPKRLDELEAEGKLKSVHYQPNDPRLVPQPDSDPASPTSEAQTIVPGQKPFPVFEPWIPIDFATIPPVQFIYDKFFARGYVSLFVAAPKVGKSLFEEAEGVDMASGRGFLTGKQQDPLRVLYVNLEVDMATLQARVAGLCRTYDLDQRQLAETLFFASAVDSTSFFLVEGEQAAVNEAVVAYLETEIVRLNLDVVIFDPLQDLSRSPETNEVFRSLGRELRRLAQAHNIAIGLVHHTRKPQPGGGSPTIDDARGGGALRGICRFNRVLVNITKDEGVKAGVDDFRRFVRIGDVESNLAPPSSARNRWFEKRSVEIGNGDSIGVIVPWTWPDAFASVTKDMAREVRRRLQESNPPMRYDSRSKIWAGFLVAEVCGFPFMPQDDAKEKKRKAQQAGDLLRGWIDCKVLQVVGIDDEYRHSKKCVVAGPVGFDVGGDD